MNHNPMIQPTAAQPFWGIATTPEGMQVEAICDTAIGLDNALTEALKEAQAIAAVLPLDAPAKPFVTKAIRSPQIAKMPWRTDDGIEHPVVIRTKATCWREFCCNTPVWNVHTHPSGRSYGYCDQHKDDAWEARNGQPMTRVEPIVCLACGNSGTVDDFMETHACVGREWDLAEYGIDQRPEGLLHEVAVSKCIYGCKVYRRADGGRAIHHHSGYGCTTTGADLVGTVPGMGPSIKRERTLPATQPTPFHQIRDCGE